MDQLKHEFRSLDPNWTIEIAQNPQQSFNGSPQPNWVCFI